MTTGVNAQKYSVYAYMYIFVHPEGCRVSQVENKQGSTWTGHTPICGRRARAAEWKRTIPAVNRNYNNCNYQQTNRPSRENLRVSYNQIYGWSAGQHPSKKAGKATGSGDPQGCTWRNRFSTRSLDLRFLPFIYFIQKGNLIFHMLISDMIYPILYQKIIYSMFI